MSFDSKNKDGLNSLHLSCSLFLLLTSGSRLIMNNSAKIQPIKFPKKEQLNQRVLQGVGVSAVCDAEYLYPQLCPKSLSAKYQTERCCGVLKTAGTGKCRPVGAAIEPKLKADTSHW